MQAQQKSRVPLFIPGIAGPCFDALYTVHCVRDSDSSIGSTYNSWYILLAYLDDNNELCYKLHTGRRTGEPVAFSRKSDADRLAASLNAFVIGGVAC
ncbi:hypothetical protein KDW_03450 [Dictyobacter vulcani]|uniref:Uncharacterized protein n=1 Tax=Dictyobacter vulcani TaxID=2607529 RepID=A0A5J4KF10_9CHLR|nr:hypothetical protein [Dictyobacter vulcani]GER86183.1 hypothetical protein KDW_03450 [Dictyobacter vulcani]